MKGGQKHEPKTANQSDQPTSLRSEAVLKRLIPLSPTNRTTEPLTRFELNLHELLNLQP